jgi:hypothetical protein
VPAYENAIAPSAEDGIENDGDAHGDDGPDGDDAAATTGEGSDAETEAAGEGGGARQRGPSVLSVVSTQCGNQHHYAVLQQ